MIDAARTLEYVQLAVFLAVAAAATLRWVQRRGAIRAWLAATLGLLGAVVLAGQFLPKVPESTADRLAQKAVICLILLFPYFLYRFMASFERPPEWLERVAAGVTLLALAVTVAIPAFPGPDEPRSVGVDLYVLLVLAQWTFLSGAVTVRFWKAGHGQATVARRRMRLLAAGAALLAFALVVTAAAPSSAEPSVASLFVELMAIVSAVLFLAGFAPPPWLFRVWRARDIERIQGAFVAMAGATSPAQVVDELLPRVVALVGAQGAILYDENGAVAGRSGAAGEGYARVPLPGGRMELFTSPYTPYFGREELEVLHNVASLVAVTLDRTHGHAREVAVREALDEAQRLAHLGSWRLDLATGALDASDEMYRLHGLVPQSEPLTRERLSAMVHPEDADRGRGRVAEALQTGVGFTNEYRIVLPDGTVRWIAARGSGLMDESGEVVALLGTCQDVTEARKLDRMRSEFVANAAHELRTPLTTVSAMATLLATQRDRLGPVETANAFAALGRQGDRARRLVTSLLDLSRLDAGRVPVQLAPTEVAGVVARALETAPPPAGTCVDVDVAPGVVAFADADRLEEILVNLLSNAYRYGGSVVAVRTAGGPDGVTIDVADDGAGVPEEFAGEMFQPFSRAASVTGTPGSGLGLAISQRLAAALGGELAYRRAGGTTHFAVTLRAAP